MTKIRRQEHPIHVISLISLCSICFYTSFFSLQSSPHQALNIDHGFLDMNHQESLTSFTTIMPLVIALACIHSIQLESAPLPSPLSSSFLSFPFLSFPFLSFPLLFSSHLISSNLQSTLSDARIWNQLIHYLTT